MANRAKSIPELPSLSALANNDLIVVVDVSSANITKKATIETLVGMVGTAAQGPEGPQGPAGPQGPQGPQGPVGPTPTPTYFISPTGNDLTANGSISAPFATVAAALQYASTNLQLLDPLIIEFFPGTYTESMVVPRSRTFIRGSAVGSSRLTRLTGGITFALNSQTQLIEAVELSDLSIISNTGAVVAAGANPYLLKMTNIRISCPSTSVKGVDITTSHPNGAQLQLYNVEIIGGTSQQGNTTGTTLVSLNNVSNSSFRDVTITNHAGPCLRISNSNIIVEQTQISSFSADATVMIESAFGPQFDPHTLPTGSIAFTQATGAITNTANGVGLFIKSNATASLGFVGVTVAGNNAIAGEVGSLFLGGSSIYFPGSNTSIDTNVTQVDPTHSALVIDSRLVSSGQTIILSNAPTSSIGNIGDKAGQVAFDNGYVYHCHSSYDGVTNIWKRVSLSNETW